MAMISAFLILNLDMLIILRCAPGQSWLSPVERVMSVLQIGLQNTALARDKMPEEMEGNLNFKLIDKVFSISFNI